MPSSKRPAPEQIWSVAVAMPEHLRQQFFAPGSWERLTQCADTWVIADHADILSEPRLERLAATDALITGWGTQLVSTQVLARMPRLRAVVHTGGSVRKIVAPEAYRHGIRVSSQAVNNAVPVAEYTLAMIILALKGVPTAARTYLASRSRPDVYRQMAGVGVYRRTVGIVGASRVGRRVIHLLRSLDVDVVVYDPYLDAAAAVELGVRIVSLVDLASCSDVVSIHAPALPETHAMIDADFLAAMRDDATIINTARGIVIDEAALVDEVSRGRIHAVLDVTYPEVPHPSSPLWTMPNVVLTPHVAGALGVELQRLGDSAIEEVWRLTVGESLRHEVFPDQLGAMA
ncbi:hydroxyacid dehydrogenase [Occultella gossypii]|uniref:Hydroxyacid dehydrogenase n=1 Tax=Occultella gossypii TaxID=2800820 RepID=A0ABS7SDQ4_9MICO|nr:hydroxyacid dehydrogenase [Occultella gossypii]MBZ2197874.1 hydroxyacid dehydrogenase [Occultella gossypii]